MRFETPLAFLLLVFTPLFLEKSWRNETLKRLGLGRFANDPPAINFSSAIALDQLPQSTRQRIRPFALSCLLSVAYLSLVLALARPQTGTHFAEVIASGRDILLVLDVSGSMEALDFEMDGEQVSRLSVLKKVTKEFVAERKGDRVGLVLFGENVFTQSPLTLDHQVINDFVDSLEVGMVGDGTALGDGIAIGLQRARDIEADSKVLVLVTDGVRTAGQLEPVDAAKIAKELGVTIYTIGIGGSGRAPFKTKDVFGREVIRYADVPLDEKTLKKVAEITSGRYFNAKNTEQLGAVYKEIDAIEEREEQVLEYIEYKEHFLPALLIGFAAFLLYEVLAGSLFATVP